MLKRLLLTGWMIVLSVAVFSQEPFYTPLDELHPGQHRYAHKNVEAKMHELMNRGDAEWHDNSAVWILHHDEGHSVTPLDKAYPVVRFHDGLALVDGHHSVLAALWMGAETVPVYVMEDMSDLDEKCFWKAASYKGYIYPIDIEGKCCPPPKDFWELVDDPNRYFAHITARKFNQEMTESLGAEYPLWIKVDRDVPFVEFRIADALKEAGLVYDEETGPTEEFVEQARQVLLKANIEGLKVVPERIHHSEIDEATLYSNCHCPAPRPRATRSPSQDRQLDPSRGSPRRK